MGPVLRARRGRAIAAELDHVFVLCDVGAPEAEALAAPGLREGAPNTHPGQGTACRRFFFRNAYLELLWVSDRDEAQREPARATRLFERWSRRRSGASPFGVVLRPGGAEPVPGPEPVPGSESLPGHGGGSPRLEAPFPTWSYRPPYLPSGFTIEVAMGTPLEEPELFYLPFAGGARSTAEPTGPGDAPAAITGVVFGLPRPGPRSAAARAAQAIGAVSFVPADDHVLTVTFDGAPRGREADMRPGLPLRLLW